MDELLERLNPTQREAVCYASGPLLILAGAGSGKTRVLTHRIAWLVRSGAARPDQVLAVTFTNKAAAEMKSRVAGLLGSEAEGMWVSTFHSACLRLLRRHADRLGFSHDFAVYDDGDQHALLKRLCKELHLPATVNPRAVSARIDQAKNRLLGPDELDQRLGALDGIPYGQVFRAYQEALKRNNALDFNDLIGHVIALLETQPDLLDKYRDRFRHLLVDEYQDTNHAQYRLVTLLGRRDRHEDEHVAVVGDDDQSIYSFRGADIRNILDFEQDFPTARVVRLEQNYRSTQAILEAATAVVARNRDRRGKTLWTEKAGGHAIEVRTAFDGRDEAGRVAEAVREMLATGLRPSQIAVFYRTHGQSRLLEEALLDARLPFHIVGGQRFYERKEVKDVLSWLRLLVNPSDDVAFERAVGEPPRGIGEASLAKLRAAATDVGLPLLATIRLLSERGELRTAAGHRLAAFAELVGALEGLSRTLTLKELLREVYARSGYVDRLVEEDTHESGQRLENLQELLNQAAAEFGGVPPPEGLRLFLDRTALVADTDALDAEDGTDRPPSRERVTLMTVHCAKGLEYAAVVLVGLEERLFPHSRSYDDPAAMEEERRLCYVAFTRAMDRLVLFHARRRMVGGETVDVRPSRFLRDVPPRLLRGEGSAFAPSRPVPAGEWVDYDVPPSRPRVPPSRLGALPPRGAVRPGPEADPEPRVVPDADEGIAVGTRVRHPRFGVGEVRRVEGPPHNLKLTIHFRDGGPKEILARYASLEVIPR